MNSPVMKALLSRGVQIPNPESVYIADDIDPERISGDHVTIHAGCKLFGSSTLILNHCELGREAPVTLENTLVGPETRLNGGSFQGAVFAGKNVFGSGAHVRSGTILEEEANAAHTVGLKQTILFPFVTLGSLINFCDCFMAGGTSRKDHSEVGSSFIHFNYTPNQDKATPSMMGDVHQGVMLDQKPIFLGGQGGLVGPVRIGYGCITAAGSIIRYDAEKEDKLLLGGGGFKNTILPRKTGVYSGITRIYNNNIRYISALIALKYWYTFIRALFFTGKDEKLLFEGMQNNLDRCLDERIRRLKDFGEKLLISKQTLSETGSSSSAVIEAHHRIIDHIGSAASMFENSLKAVQTDAPDAEFISMLKQKDLSNGYINTIRSLTSGEKQTGSTWLLNIENSFCDKLIVHQG